MRKNANTNKTFFTVCLIPLFKFHTAVKNEVLIKKQ